MHTEDQETEDAAGRDQLDLCRPAEAPPPGRDWAADLAMCGKASPGPWAYNHEREGVWPRHGDACCIADTAGGDRPDEDGDFIAAAREGWPAAILRGDAAEAEVLRLRAENEGLRGSLAGAMGVYFKLRAVGEVLAKAPFAPRIRFTYTNWRGETAEREAVPHRLYFGTTEYHPEPQWLLLAHTARGPRDFAVNAMEDIRDA